MQKAKVEERERHHTISLVYFSGISQLTREIPIALREVLRGSQRLTT